MHIYLSAQIRHWDTGSANSRMNLISFQSHDPRSFQRYLSSSEKGLKNSDLKGTEKNCEDHTLKKRNSFSSPVQIHEFIYLCGRSNGDA